MDKVYKIKATSSCFGYHISTEIFSFRVQHYCSHSALLQSRATVEIAYVSLRASKTILFRHICSRELGWFSFLE